MLMDKKKMLQTVKRIVFLHDLYVNVYISSVCLSIIYPIKVKREENNSTWEVEIVGS